MTEDNLTSAKPSLPSLDFLSPPLRTVRSACSSTSPLGLPLPLPQAPKQLFCLRITTKRFRSLLWKKTFRNRFEVSRRSAVLHNASLSAYKKNIPNVIPKRHRFNLLLLWLNVFTILSYFYCFILFYFNLLFPYSIFTPIFYILIVFVILFLLTFISYFLIIFLLFFLFLISVKRPLKQAEGNLANVYASTHSHRVDAFLEGG